MTFESSGYGITALGRETKYQTPPPHTIDEHLPAGTVFRDALGFRPKLYLEDKQSRLQKSLLSSISTVQLSPWLL